MTQDIYDDEADKITALLLGRRIVGAGEKDIQGTTLFGRSYTERVAYLLLDDGAELRIRPNEGCGGCTSGNYWINSVAAFDNAITAVEHVNKYGLGEDDDETLTIVVYAEGASQEAISVSGSEGNGYYGRGFRVEVVRL